MGPVVFTAIMLLALAAFVTALVFFLRGARCAWNDPGFAPHRARLIWNYMGAIQHAPEEAKVHFRRFYAALAVFIACCIAGVLAGFTLTTTSR
ncbi:MAG TPA: hypothetical protein PK812_11815 [Beijerinckiaceae bacterium]|nr:hypothetical protein [Beijerinckiaceae bacterium]